MRKERKILYLDQFAVSNMYDAASSTVWGLLRHTIQEKVNKGVLSCPMPLEHLYETVGRSNKDKMGNQNDEYSRKIIEQHNFFRELANGTAFYGYEEIAATEIIMLLRQGKINPIKSMYLHKALYSQIDISAIYEEGHTFNEENHKYNRSLTQGVNELREITRPLNKDIRAKQNNSTDPLFLKAIVRSLVDSYIVGLKDFYKKGFVKVRGVNCGTFEGAHKVDILIYKLTKKRINKRETEKLIQELETNGFERIPSMYIHSLLSADLALYDKQQVPNDEIDIDRVCRGIAYLRLFFC